MSLFRINTNVSALNAQRQLDSGNDQLAEAQKRLSSGLRINSAADDAAGLAISQKTTTQIRGLTQASTNAQDGISMIQTASGGLEETQSSLQRMRELAVQASNDTLTEEDRGQIQREVDALAEEIQRISDQTEFNTKNLLDGSLETDGALGTQQLQVGANEGQTIEFNVSDMGTSSDGISIAGDGTLDGEHIDNVILSNESAPTGAAATSVGVEVAEQSDGTQVLQLAENVDLNGNGTETGEGTVLATQQADSPRTFETENVGGLSNDGEFTVNAQVEAGSEFEIADLSVDDPNFTNSANTTVDADPADVDFVNFNSNLESGDYELRVVNRLEALTTGELQLLDENGEIVADQTMNNLSNGLTNENSEVVATFNNEQIAVDTAGFLDETRRVSTEFAFTDADGHSLYFGGPDVENTDKAERAISTLDEAINRVSSERSELGALQNRLETTIRVNDITAENLQAARSRIRDADVAQESVKQTRGNILVQAGTSVLAQANQNPQAALQLLGG